jgi:uncharacterized protein (TIGR04255 family)
MARPREHLQNAPIAEAVIDFRVLRQEQVSSETFANLGSLIGKQYEQKTLLQSFMARFGVDNGRVLDPLQVKLDLGWRYQAANEVAQFRVDGFTFSRIEQYTTWSEVFDEAFRLWGVYVDAAKPRQVSRVAVRYINRMQLPAVKDLREYLEAPPHLPAPIPQAIREFLTRVYVADEARNASAVIVQALEPPMDSSHISLLLDIDAFRDVTLAHNDPAIPAIFGELRQLKNDIFFASITEKTAEIYS